MAAMISGAVPAMLARIVYYVLRGQAISVAHKSPKRQKLKQPTRCCYLTECSK